MNFTFNKKSEVNTKIYTIYKKIKRIINEINLINSPFH
jgi:hypothetical protein